MKFRSIGAAVGAGVLLAAAVPGVAQAVDPLYPPVLTPPTCAAKAVSNASKIRVDMGPDLVGDAFYTFRIDKRVKGKWTRALKTYRTQGSTEVRTVNVSKGTYRIKCYGKAFPIAAPALDATSNTVKIKR